MVRTGGCAVRRFELDTWLIWGKRAAHWGEKFVATALGGKAEQDLWQGVRGWLVLDANGGTILEAE